ncbi:MAG TPA: hypothetical protein VMV47_04310 [Bacteroidales bacterium]|nr:hypothetical protein [Bacteroidales bacterium]
MIATDFKIALRNLNRNKVQSSISILGLEIGLGSIILIAVITISSQSWRTATRNPVAVLRYE